MYRIGILVLFFSFQIIIVFICLHNVFLFVFYPRIQVYQVLDQQKQLFALKYVDLLEADDQSTESYKNEIKHLNHLQQHSDQIIKLYD